MADEKAATTPAGNKKLIIIIAAVVVLLSGGGVAAFLMLGGEGNAADGQTAGVEEARPQEATYVDLKPEFVINFRDSNDRPKFLKAELSVAMTDSDTEEAVMRHMPAIRNNLVLLFSRQIYDDLIPHEGKEQLRQQALSEVQSVLTAQIGKPGIDDLFFSNFVMH